MFLNQMATLRVNRKMREISNHVCMYISPYSLIHISNIAIIKDIFLGKINKIYLATTKYQVFYI